MAARIIVGLAELLVACEHVGRKVDLQGGQCLPVLGHGLGVGRLHHMEHHVVVTGVLVVPVPEPVGGLHVDFHISGPHGLAYLHLGVEEVGPLVAVGLSGVDYLHAFPLGGEEGSERENLVFPCKME